MDKSSKDMQLRKALNDILIEDLKKVSTPLSLSYFYIVVEKHFRSPFNQP